MLRQILLLSFTYVGGLSAFGRDSTSNGPLKVIVMAGQSNMQGFGIVEQDAPGSLRRLATDERTRRDFEEATDGQGGWRSLPDIIVSTVDQNGKAGPLTVGFGVGSDRIGLEFGLGIELANRLQEPMLIIKANWGGQSLAADFRPPSAVSQRGYPQHEDNSPLVNLSDSGQMAGHRFRDILESVGAAIQNLPNLIPDYNQAAGYELVAFEWHQGWNDAVDFDRDDLSDPENMANEYEHNLADFVVDMRAELARRFSVIADMPFVLGTCGHAGSPGNHKNEGKFGDFVERSLRLIWSGYTNVGNETQHPEVGAVRVVDSVPFSRREDESPGSQGYHWWENAETYFRLGRAMGEATYEALGGVIAPTPPPPPPAPTPVPTPLPTPVPGPPVDEAACRAYCERRGHCCSDPAVSANQLLSCAQACKIRAHGVTRHNCEAACMGPRECDRQVAGLSFNTCSSCSDADPQRCPNGVPDTTACLDGCATTEQQAPSPTPMPTPRPIDDSALTPKDGLLRWVCILVAFWCLQI